PDVVAATYRSMNASDLGAWFRSARADLLLTFGGLEGKERVPWFGPEISVTSSATARLMETWAHAQDLFDAFALERPATDRIKHIAHLGVRTMGFSFVLNERPVPDLPVRVELEAPSGVLWTWGADNARDSVTGTALDFCLVVTQRRNLADTSLTVDGAVAGEWMSIAQAFAGAPGPGRAPAEAARRVS
ncbi:MAG TPA: maleylpyruvate isomerase family mycothiol-dependent enzyme, partial [Nocardioidaceae bacterium]|nr:maleylpyruvate isomerase family mycothiol-dependent enzyme [Nocardioidaceae bacterium]